MNFHPSILSCLLPQLTSPRLAVRKVTFLCVVLSVFAADYFMALHLICLLFVFIFIYLYFSLYLINQTLSHLLLV